MTDMHPGQVGGRDGTWRWPATASAEDEALPERRGADRSGCVDGALEVAVPGSFTAAARAQEPELLRWAGLEVAVRLDHLMDGHRVFLPYLMAGHFPAHSADASPAVKLLALPLLRSPFTGGVCVAARVLDPWREFGVWVDPAHLAHRDCAVCTPVWARRAGEFDAAQADLAAAVASGGEEYVPLLFALADVYPDPRGLGTRPRVIVHVSDITGLGDMDGRGR